jgi:hypothetical protein
MVSKEVSDAAPSDAELFEALRLLTPATGSADQSPSPQSLAAAGQLLAEEAMRDAAAGPRWVAEPMTLSPGEGAVSLEAEMMQTLAEPAAPTGNESEFGRITGVAAIAAAVETRLAEAESAVIGKYVAEHVAQQGAEPSSEQCSEQSVEPTSAGQPAEIKSENNSEPSAELTASDSNSANAEPSNGVGNDVVPVAQSTEDAPKAMAAAAAAEASASGADASTIANIVDRVMADLRPRIVEEIAKKLAKKN